MSNCSIILRSVGQLTRLLYIQCIQATPPPPPPPPFLPPPPPPPVLCCMRINEAVNCSLPCQWGPICTPVCAALTVSHLKGEVSLFHGLDVIREYFFTPPEGQDCHTAPSLFSLFFLHLCRSLRVMQMHSPDPSTHPISILRVLSPVWAGCARGWQNQGRWNEWKHCTSSHQFPSVFNVLLIHNPLKLLNLAA